MRALAPRLLFLALGLMIGILATSVLQDARRRIVPPELSITRQITVQAPDNSPPAIYQVTKTFYPNKAAEVVNQDQPPATAQWQFILYDPDHVPLMSYYAELKK